MSNTPRNTLRLVTGLVLFSVLGCAGAPEPPPTRWRDPASLASPQHQPAPPRPPLERYGGHAITATAMPHGRDAAFRWARNMGTLVAYETFLRRHPRGAPAAVVRRLIETRFVPGDERWQESWKLYSRMEIIEGAIVDSTQGFILIGRTGSGTLAPFFYEDLITAIRCIRAGERVGVTMNRVFEARFTHAENPNEIPYVAYETSVDFYARDLRSTHLAHLLFEADRCLKSIGSGWDIFLREPIRCTVPGYESEIAMERAIPYDPEKRTSSEYGRIWIELTTAELKTTDAQNVAMFSEFQLEVRAVSDYEPPIRMASHLQEHFALYGRDFPILLEVERAARVVAIARWLVRDFPSVAERLVIDAYPGVEVQVPPVIPARADIVHEGPGYVTWLCGGVVFPDVNRYEDDPGWQIGDCRVEDVARLVIDSQPDDRPPAWPVILDRSGNATGDRLAWRVSRGG